MHGHAVLMWACSGPSAEMEAAIDVLVGAMVPSRSASAWSCRALRTIQDKQASKGEGLSYGELALVEE